MIDGQKDAKKGEGWTLGLARPHDGLTQQPHPSVFSLSRVGGGNVTPPPRLSKAHNHKPSGSLWLVSEVGGEGKSTFGFSPIVPPFFIQQTCSVWHLLNGFLSPVEQREKDTTTLEEKLWSCNIAPESYMLPCLPFNVLSHHTTLSDSL